MCRYESGQTCYPYCELMEPITLLLILIAVGIFIVMLVIFKFFRRLLLFLVLACALIIVIYKLGWFPDSVEQLLRSIKGGLGI